jgi:glycerophosphoryl diester phosphodiesterase
MTLFVVIPAALAVVILGYLFSWRPNNTEPFYINRPLWFAHRGLLHLAPENTLPSYLTAVKKKVPALEMDVVCTRDGFVVCSHNYDLERETDGLGYIFQRDYEYIRSVNAASKWPDRREEIPLLKLVLEQIPAPIRINIELKTRKVFDFRTALKAAKMVKQLGLGDRVILSSFNPFSIGMIKLVYPALLTGYIFETWAHFSLIRIARPDCLHPRADFVTDDLVRFARQRHLSINVWTVNTRPAMEWLLRKGVDGIITDRPEFRDEILSPTPAKT